ncbi:MAG TPA: hypothetical protein VLL05_07625 [Terriglobales bacterium]|nr:hypothetical protein [Terriglobales bacterium]
MSIVLLLVAIFYGGRHYFENLVHDRTQPWAVFKVPTDPTLLVGVDAKLAMDAVTLCNRANSDWNDILIQIDQGYLARLNYLRGGECKSIPVHDFATESWKRMPPPRDLYVTRVAVLTQVPENGYAEMLQKK